MTNTIPGEHEAAVPGTSPKTARCQLESCHRRFEPKTDRTRFCCEAHRVAAWRGGAVSPLNDGSTWYCEAPGCGNPYSPRSAHQHYCSDTCRGRAKYWRNKGQATTPRKDAAAKVGA
jgi:hypothetical protein